MTPAPSQVWLVVEPIDMRAGIDGLSQRIQNLPVYTMTLAPSMLYSASNECSILRNSRAVRIASSWFLSGEASMWKLIPVLPDGQNCARRNRTDSTP
jgi:hypothetical protein